MTVYRLHSPRYAAYDATGATLYGGRWNRKGIPVIYAAESRALCALEVLVNAGQLADDYVVTAIFIPSNLRIESLLIEHLPNGWNSAIPEKATQDLGTQWALSLTSPALTVPSSIVWRERNYILNPSHSAFRQFEFGPTEPFHFDERLKRMVASSKTK